MNILRRVLFHLLNTPEDRKILNKWKKEGRIPESYYRSLQKISPDVEDEYRRENNLGPFPDGDVKELYQTQEGGDR
jgi:hypothetical protein